MIEMTDEEIKKLVVSGAIADFEGDCPCPYSKDIKGNECGQSSAYFNYHGGNKPICYPSDVNINQVNEYRKQYGIPRKNELDLPLNS